MFCEANHKPFIKSNTLKRTIYIYLDLLRSNGLIIKSSYNDLNDNTCIVSVEIIRRCTSREYITWSPQNSYQRNINGLKSCSPGVSSQAALGFVMWRLVDIFCHIILKHNFFDQPSDRGLCNQQDLLQGGMLL